MVNYTDAVNEIKWPLEREVQNVSLHDMNVVQVPSISVGCFHSHGEIDTHHSTRPELGSQQTMAPLTASGIKHHPAFEVRRGQRRHPTQKFLLVGVC